MIGTIHSDQKCKDCGSRFIDTGKALVCPNHKNRTATRFKVMYKNRSKRFHSYDDASKYLYSLRFGFSDPSLSVTNACQKFVEHFKARLEMKQISASHYRNVANSMKLFSEFYGDKDVTKIGYSDINSFLSSFKNIKLKTLHDYNRNVKMLFKYLKSCNLISEIPSFPIVSYQHADRERVPKDVQQKIIDYVYKNYPTKVFVGFKFLSQYLNVRPKELLSIKHNDINLKEGYIQIRDTKEKKGPKYVYLLLEDRLLLQPLVNNSDDYFFCHEDGSRFGKDHFNLVFMKFKHKFTDKNVTFYSLTKHSSITALGDYVPEDEIKTLSGHTSKAFDRYFKTSPTAYRNLAAMTQAGKNLTKSIFDDMFEKKPEINMLEDDMVPRAGIESAKPYPTIEIIRLYQQLTRYLTRTGFLP